MWGQNAFKASASNADTCDVYTHKAPTSNIFWPNYHRMDLSANKPRLHLESMY